MSVFTCPVKAYKISLYRTKCGMKSYSSLNVVLLCHFWGYIRYWYMRYTGNDELKQLVLTSLVCNRFVLAWLVRVCVCVCVCEREVVCGEEGRL